MNKNYRNYSLLKNTYSNNTVENYEIFNDKGEEVSKKTETEEQKIAKDYIKGDDVVLELGGRYGSVSVAVSEMLNNSYNLVVVEPDTSIIKYLDNNRSREGHNFHIFNGFVSKRKMSLTGKDYGKTQVVDNNSKLPTKTVEQLENDYGLKFNVLIADCEGCLETFFKDFPNFHKQLRLITYEKDKESKCNYEYVENILKNSNFKIVKDGFRPVWIRRF